MNRLLRIASRIGLLVALCGSLLLPVSSARDDWQPIDPADLALKDNPKAPGADAMVLYRETKVNEPLAYTQEYYRMKIFTKEGVKYADVEIPYVKGEAHIDEIRGRTIHPDGSIANFDGKTFDKVAEKGGGLKVFVKAFSLPDVQPGSIIEYRYQVQLDEQRYYIGFEQWKPEGELYTRSVRFSILPLSGDVGQGQLVYRMVHMPENVTRQDEAKGWKTFDLHDIAGVQNEELMPPDSAIRARIEFFYRDRNEPNNETQEQYWKRIDKKWNDFQEKFVGKKGVMENEVSRLVTASDSPEAKLRKIYARVLEIRNLSMESEKSKKEQQGENLKPNSNVEDVLKHSYGSEREINLLFVGLARAAGFDATEAYVAPANLNVFTPQSQEANQLGTDIVWVRAGTQEYYLDPGARYYPFGLLPWYETETSGIRLRKDAPEMVNVPAMKSSDATVERNCQLTLNENGDGSGKVQFTYAGIIGAMERAENRSEDEAGRKKEIGDEIRRALPAGSTFEMTTISNWDDINRPVEVEGTVKIPGAGTPTGRRMLVPVTLFATAYADTFKSAKRVNDVYFGYRYQQLDDVKYQAPDSYKVESLPAIAPIDMKAVVYNASTTSQGNLIETKRHLGIEATFFAVKYYEALRSFFNRVKSSDETQFVLESSASAKGN